MEIDKLNPLYIRMLVTLDYTPKITIKARSAVIATTDIYTK
jgi:hypothetical protein